jgi:hypothetical protein
LNNLLLLQPSEKTNKQIRKIMGKVQKSCKNIQTNTTKHENSKKERKNRNRKGKKLARKLELARKKKEGVEIKSFHQHATK